MVFPGASINVFYGLGSTVSSGMDRWFLKARIRLTSAASPPAPRVSSVWTTLACPPHAAYPRGGHLQAGRGAAFRV